MTTLLPGYVTAAEPPIDISPVLFQQLDALIKQAASLLQKGKMDALQAVALLERAHAVVEESAATRWPWHIRVGPIYGHVLLALGSSQKALAVLEQALAAQTRVLDERLMPFYKVLQHFDTGMGKELLGVEFKRQLLSVVVVRGQGAHTLAELIFDQSIGSSEILFTLGRAQFACGQVAALARLYLNHVSRAVLPADDNMPARTAREHRHFKFGVLLARSGQRLLADQAMRHALRLNFGRQQEISDNVASYTAQLAAFGIGRQMLSVWLGRLLFDQRNEGLSAAQREELMALILQTKGLGVRYAEHLHKLLHASTNPATVFAKEQISRLEDQMAALPVSQEGLMELLKLSVQHSMHLAQALPELRDRGLATVVASGEMLLPQVQQALKTDVAIGFMVYHPLAGTGDAAAAPRYLRYCVADDLIDLRDVGACKVINQATFGFRRALLAGGDGLSHGNSLTSWLLGDLPERINLASRWVMDPDGALALLPFEALPDVNKEPVLMRRTVRYVTSLVQLIEKVGETPAVGPACIVANPAYPISSQQDGNGQSGRISMRTFDSGHVVVPPLPDTSLEALAVATALTRMGWSVDRLEEEEATADALLALLQPPRVLHVASHAILFASSVESETVADGNQNSSNNIIDLLLPGRRGALVLAGKERPSLLLAMDFTKIPLQGTQLVVLSACDTGNGDVDVGEGVNSMRRSLEQAGVASTVTSLWPVPSRGTATLMAGFYRQLAQGHPKSRALQLAKIEHRERGAPTVEWAGFLLAGSDKSLVSEL